MNVLNFLSVPRAFGNPKQVFDPNMNPVVHSRSQLINLINQNNDGIHDVFVSHNKLLSFLDRKPFQIAIDKMFFDFDTKLKSAPSDTLEEVRKVIDYFDEMKIPYLVDFSGAKGFHIFMPLIEKIYTNEMYLSNMTRSVMLYLKRELGLNTIDPSVATPTKLCRVMYSTHPKTGLKCSPLNPEWVREWNIEQIMDYAKNPNEWKCDLLMGKKYLNLEEFIDYCGIEVEEEMSVAREQFVLSPENIEFGNPEDEFLAKLLHLPCLVRGILGVENATHYARFVACTHLKSLGYSPAWVFKFFLQRQYRDVDLEAESRYQINYIFNRDLCMPSCRRLREEGLCIGKKCQYFRG